MQRNKLTRIDFIASPSLVELNLASNGIKRLRLSTSIFPHLTRLNLSKNRISDIQNLQHQNLKHLVLSILLIYSGECGIQAMDF
jgi:Leucine-rich repeat (LRR) protein